MKISSKNYKVVFVKVVDVCVTDQQKAKIKAVAKLMDEGNIGINNIFKIIKKED